MVICMYLRIYYLHAVILKVHIYIHVSTQLGVGRHWWFNYPGLLFDAEVEFACLSGWLDWWSLPCNALIRPNQLSCLTSSIILVEHLHHKEYVMGLNPT